MGAFRFVDAVKKKNRVIREINESSEEKKSLIKPIIGCVLNVCEDHLNKNYRDNGYQIVFLSKNKNGYNNLSKLSSLAYTKGFYYHEVNGFQVEDIRHGKIGEIEYINDQTPQHLFVINSNDKEVLIPINDDFILELDRINKTIKMDLPEGLLKIYI